MQLETVDNEGNVGGISAAKKTAEEEAARKAAEEQLLHRPRPSGKLRRPLDRHSSNSKRSRMCIMRIALKFVRLERLRFIRGSPDTVASSIAITMAWPASSARVVEEIQRLFGPPSGNIK